LFVSRGGKAPIALILVQLGEVKSLSQKIAGK
jgi:hypothetical protein